jgi:hypothetical protein
MAATRGDLPTQVLLDVMFRVWDRKRIAPANGPLGKCGFT